LAIAETLGDEGAKRPKPPTHQGIKVVYPETSCPVAWGGARNREKAGGISHNDGGGKMRGRSGGEEQEEEKELPKPFLLALEIA